MNDPRRSRRPMPLIAVLAVVLVSFLARNVLRPAKPAAPEPSGPKSGTAALPPSSPASRPAPAAGKGAAAAESGSSAGLAPGLAVNEEHVFEGLINRKGRPVGFHSRPGGRDPEGARLVGVLEGPNPAGIYTAEVEIRDPRSGRWLRKTSTFYPDRMQRTEVLQAIHHAFESRQGGGEKFRGPSGAGFTIEGYYQDGRINTAYPIYTRR